MTSENEQRMSAEAMLAKLTSCLEAEIERMEKLAADGELQRDPQRRQLIANQLRLLRNRYRRARNAYESAQRMASRDVN